MLDPRWRKVIRDLALHKARTALVVLAITVGIVGAGSVLDTWALLRRVTRDGYLASNPRSATIRTDSIDAALLERVRSLPTIAAAEARRTAFGRVAAGGDWRTAVLFAIGDYPTQRIGTLAPQTGMWPPADGTVVIESSSVEYAGIGVGEPASFQIGEIEPKPLPVTGIVRDVGLAPGWMEHVVYAFVTPATLAQLGLPSSLDQLEFVVRDRSLDRESVRKIAYQVKGLVEATGRRVKDIDVPEPGRHVHAGQIDSLLYTKGAFGLVTLLLSGFLVLNLVSAMLTGQVREIGVMKAIGARSDQIAGMYLVLAALLGVAACAVAMPIAALIGRWYAEFIAGMLNFDTRGFGIPWWAFAAQVVVGAFLPVVAAAVPVIRGCKVPVAEALRDYGIEVTTSGASGRWLTRVGGVTRPILLSLRNAFRRRQRMALTLLTLSIGGAVYLGALNLQTSIRRSVQVIFGDQIRFDLALRFARAAPADSIEALVARMPGVARVEAWGQARAALDHGGGILGSSFPVTGLPAGSSMTAYPLLEGRWLAEGDRAGIVVNRRLLGEEPGLSVGGEASLVIGGRPARFTVIGVVESGVEPAAFLLRQALADAKGSARFETAVVRSVDRSPDGQAALSRRLRGELDQAGLNVGSSQLIAESRRVLEDHLLLVAETLAVMAQMMIVVGGLGLASTMSLAVLERTREIGVLRAIGARHHAIHAMVQVEGLVIGLASWALAIPLSLPISVGVGRAFGRIMIPVPTIVAPGLGNVLTWLLVVIVVSVAASAWPAFRATRVPTAAALAYE